jgi:rubredoxin
MDQYKCSICGHVYDPEKGEPRQDIKPGIDFLSLPSDWACPVCTAGKDQFVKM